MISVLGHPCYRRLFAAQVLSLLGSGLTTVALGLLAYDLAGANAGVVLGTALALKMAVYVGFSPVAELIARRLPRKKFLIALDLLRATFVLGLPFVTEVWHIYLLVVLFQACSAAFTPVFQATIPDILTDEDAYTHALSLSRLAYDLESLLSPMLAGLMLSLASFHWLFGGTTLGFLASAVLVAGAALPQRKSEQMKVSFVRRLTRGAWIYLRTPRLRGLLALSLAVAAAGAMVIVNSVVVVREGFGGSERQVAMLFAAYGAGSMIVALSLPRLLRVVRQRTVMIAGGVGLIAGLILVPVSLMAPLVWVTLLWAVMGAAAALVQTPAGLLLRRSAHPEDRPAVFAAQFALSHACWLVTYPLAGWGGAILGLPMVAGVLAVCAALGVWVALRVWPAEDTLVIEHEHDEIEHEHDPDDPIHHHAATLSTRSGSRHRHRRVRHAHPFVIDDHHPIWPRA